jgi:hypothetical protein
MKRSEGVGSRRESPIAESVDGFVDVAILKSSCTCALFARGLNARSTAVRRSVKNNMPTVRVLINLAPLRSVYPLSAPFHGADTPVNGVINPSKYRTIIGYTDI